MLNSFFGIGGAKSVSLFMRLQVLSLSLLGQKVSFRFGAVWPFRILLMEIDFRYFRLSSRDFMARNSGHALDHNNMR